MAIEDIIARGTMPNVAGQVAAGKQFAQQQEMGELDIAAKRAQLSNMMKPKQMDPLKKLDYIERSSAIADRTFGLLRRGQTPEEREQIWQSIRPRLQNISPQGMELPETYIGNEDAVNQAWAMTSSAVPAFSDYRKTVEEARRAAQSGDIQGARALMSMADTELRNTQSQRGMYQFQDPETGDTVDVWANDLQGIQELRDRGFQRVGIVQRQEQGGPQELTQPRPNEMEDLRIQEAATKTLLDVTGRLRELVPEGDSSPLGAVGGATRILEGAASQVIAAANMAGGTAEIDGEEVSELSLMDRSLYEDILDNFKGKAAKSAAVQTNLVTLAYLRARSLDSKGRVSDKDVENQLRAISSWGSANQFRAGLNEIDRLAIQQYNNRAQTLDSPLMDSPTVQNAQENQYMDMSVEEIMNDFGG